MGVEPWYWSRACARHAEGVWRSSKSMGGERSGLSEPIGELPNTLVARFINKKLLSIALVKSIGVDGTALLTCTHSSEVRGVAMVSGSTPINPAPNPNSVRQSYELQSHYLATTGLHAIAFEVALSGVVWFLAVVCLNFAGGPRLELPVAIVSGILVMFFTFLLLAASVVHQRSTIETASGSTPCSASHRCG